MEDLVPVVGNAKYAIFFSCKGPRSVADEIAGGDFDGDMYWVSRNSQVSTHSSLNFLSQSSIPEFGFFYFQM